MELEILPIQRGVARHQVLAGCEAQARGGLVNPLRCSLQFEEDADRGFVESDDAGLARRGEFRPVLFVSKAPDVTQAFEELDHSLGVGDVKFDFLTTLVAFPGGWTFVGDRGQSARAPDTKQSVRLP